MKKIDVGIVRRVVTANDGDGQAQFIFDDNAPNIKIRKAAGWTSTVIWHTENSPAQFINDKDRSYGDFNVEPTKCGTVFRIVDFPPESLLDSTVESNIAVLNELGLKSTLPDNEGFTHKAMHCTNTVDYAVVMSGEIDMVFPSGKKVHLVEGDVLVQQGTPHAWVNHGKSNCRIAFILIDANLNNGDSNVNA
jgi:mannose-6-phosphate isomerase-like protein (cupin superfamily)